MEKHDSLNTIIQNGTDNSILGHANGLNSEGPNGIGGWLIFIAIGRLVMPVVLIWSIINSINIINQLKNNLEESLVSMWTRAILFETGGNVFLLICEIILIFLFFGRKKIFPKVFILFMILASILSIVSGLVSFDVISSVNSTHFEDLPRTILTYIIWIPYILKSVRVKNTFIR